MMLTLGFAAALMLAITLPGTLYLALLSLAGLLPPRRRDVRPLSGRVAIVVPAHDESDVIAQTLQNLMPLAEADGATEVVVIADNCSDDTAAQARSAGARVLERRDEEHRGKGYALDFAFNQLMREDFVAFAVIDADSSAEAHFLPCLRKTLGSEMAAQARYTVRNADASARTRLAEVALAGFNVLRPRGRDRLGYSVGILGNGFALRRATLEAVPYTAASVVEDLEYHLRLIDANLRVAFMDEAYVRGDMPTGTAGAQTQRARWEGGRLRLLREHGLSLLGKACKGQLRFLEPLADLTLLPLGYHAMALSVVLILGAVGNSPLLSVAALVSLALVLGHVIAAVSVAKLPWSHLLLLTRVPGYLVWKLGTLTATLAGASSSSAWIRTDRNGR